MLQHMLYRAILCYLLGLGLSACGTAQPLNIPAAQATLFEAWSVDQHVVWELEWPAAPVGGPVTVETWRAGPRYRFEILEATVPALVGETLVFDGHTAWQYNRFDPAPAPISAPTLSPVSDAFALVNRLLLSAPSSAAQETMRFKQRATQKISLAFTNGDQLTFWRDEVTGLPVRLQCLVAGQPLTLRAKSFEALRDPTMELFQP
jgi:hypothetical protein